MNPNGNTQGTNQVNSNGFGVPQTNSNVQPQGTPMGGIQIGQTVASVPTSAPVNPVTPSPMPAQGTITPQATPMPAQNTPVIPQPVVTPTPSTPVISQSVVENTTKEDPNAKLTEVSIPPSASTTAEPQVVNTVKSKSSNVLLFIIIIILVAFAINIDKMAEMYDNYMKTGSLTSTTVTPDNTSDGFIKIDDASSSMKIDDVKFYKFSKEEAELSISFNYETYEKIDSLASLNMYIELYNANKEILYKELFSADGTIQMNVVTKYSMKLDADVFGDAYYAKVVKYTSSEVESTSTLTCTLTDEKYQYENVYHFKNNELISYDVTKTSLNEEDDSLQKEYYDINSKVTASLENKTLKYTVDLELNKDFKAVYPKGLTPTIVKSRETLKKWNCE